MILHLQISEVTLQKLEAIQDAIKESGYESHDIESVANQAIQFGIDELGRLFFDYLQRHTQ